MPVKKMKKDQSKQLMEKIWMNPEDPAGYGGVAKLAKRTKVTEKKTGKWLSSQLAYSLNKPMRKRFPTRPYRTNGINDVWQMDLMEMIPYAKINKGFKYILTCIDVFSRVASAVPTKTKNATEMSEAIQILFKDNVPANLQTDAGKEFYNSKVKSILETLNINHYSVYTPNKAAVVERFNRTLRDRLKRYFVAQGNKSWISVLPKVISSYNHSSHAGLNGLRPVDVTSKNESKIRKNKINKLVRPKKSKYKVGDFVRISKYSASPFIKNFDQNWSDEVFQITNISAKYSPVMYIIKDFENNQIVGKFYEQELQVIPYPDVFRIEKILKTKGVGKHKQYFVKWHGYKIPSWTSTAGIIRNDSE